MNRVSFVVTVLRIAKRPPVKEVDGYARREKVREDDSVNICVYGASSAQLKDIYYEKTQELGRAMGKRGHGLVFGGGATG